MKLTLITNEDRVLKIWEDIDYYDFSPQWWDFEIKVILANEIFAEIRKAGIVSASDVRLLLTTNKGTVIKDFEGLRCSAKFFGGLLPELEASDLACSTIAEINVEIYNARRTAIAEGEDVPGWMESLERWLLTGVVEPRVITAKEKRLQRKYLKERPYVNPYLRKEILEQASLKDETKEV